LKIIKSRSTQNTSNPIQKSKTLRKIRYGEELTEKGLTSSSSKGLLS
jgi:hypothetical protein